MTRKTATKLVSLMIVISVLMSSVSAFALSPDYTTKVKNPLVNLPIDERLGVKNGTIVLEAEDIINKKGAAKISNDEKASNGQALLISGTKWNVSDLPYPDIDTPIYLDESQEEGIYKLWYRARTLTSETASVWWDRNNGIWTSTWYSTVQDGEYRWASTQIELHHGENYLKVQRRGAMYLDKIIITINNSFKPSGRDDEPVYRTPEQEKEYLYSLYDTPTIKPIAGHPRLYATKDYIPTLKKNAETGDFSYMYERVKKYADEEINCKLDTSLAKNHNATLLVKIMSRAFVWLIGEKTDVNHARQTYRHMVDYLETVRTPDDEGDITRSRGNYLVAASIVYDWLYDVMTEEERAHLLELIKKVVASKEISWPPTSQSSLVSHAGEREIFRDMLAAGVAVYDEYPELYDVAVGRMFDEMVPGRIWMHSTGRPWVGNDYGEARWSAEMWADMTFYKMGYPSIFGNLNGEPYTWLLYSRMSNGSMMPKGDMYSLATRTRDDLYYANYPEGIFLACQMYENPYFENEWDRISQVYSVGEYDKFFYMLFDEADETDVTSGKIKDDMPLTLISKYPSSALVARTSWQEGYNSDNAMVTLDMHEAFISDHQEVYTGDFQFYYKGLLAMNTGVYNTNTQHNEGYDRRSIAGNVMLCYDPTETFAPCWSNVTVPNDGGQRNPYIKEDGTSRGAYVTKMDEYDIDENGIIQNRSLVVADGVRKFSGPNAQTPAFSYIGGDLTNAYSDKITDYHRSMVFMNLFNDDYPAALIVFDKMSSADKNFKKTWLLHSQQKPEVKGDTTIITRTDAQFDGKLVNRTLLPDRGGFRTSVIGGENNEMFSVGGIEMPPKNALEGGKYRIEISPSAAKTDDVFLNAMYVTTASQNLPELKMHKEQGSGWVGVTVMDRMVTFSKEAKLFDSGLSISVRDNGYSEVSVLLTDIAEGKWTVTAKDGSSFNIESKSGENTLFFKAAPGSYKISKAEDNAAITSFETQPHATSKVGDFMMWRAAVDATSVNMGNFLYLAKPSKAVDGVAYVGAETLKEFGASVIVNGNSVSIIGANGSLKVNSGSKECVADGISSHLEYAPFTDNGTVYIALKDCEAVTGYTFSYRPYADLVFAKKVSE